MSRLTLSLSILNTMLIIIQCKAGADLYCLPPSSGRQSEKSKQKTK